MNGVWLWCYQCKSQSRKNAMVEILFLSSPIKSGFLWMHNKYNNQPARRRGRGDSTMRRRDETRQGDKNKSRGATRRGVKKSRDDARRLKNNKSCNENKNHPTRSEYSTSSKTIILASRATRRKWDGCRTNRCKEWPCGRLWCYQWGGVGKENKNHATKDLRRRKRNNIIRSKNHATKDGRRKIK